jgi:hypothetical protein
MTLFRRKSTKRTKSNTFISKLIRTSSSSSSTSSTSSTTSTSTFTSTSPSSTPTSSNPTTPLTRSNPTLLPLSESTSPYKLPPDWELRYDTILCQFYYINVKENIIQFDSPIEVINHQ